MPPSKIDQMRASQETGSESDIRFGRALMPSFFRMYPQKAAFLSLWMHSLQVQKADGVQLQFIPWLVAWYLNTIFMVFMHWKSHVCSILFQ